MIVAGRVSIKMAPVLRRLHPGALSPSRMAHARWGVPGQLLVSGLAWLHLAFGAWLVRRRRRAKVL